MVSSSYQWLRLGTDACTWVLMVTHGYCVLTACSMCGYHSPLTAHRSLLSACHSRVSAQCLLLIAYCSLDAHCMQCHTQAVHVVYALCALHLLR